MPDHPVLPTETVNEVMQALRALPCGDVWNPLIGELISLIERWLTGFIRRTVRPPLKREDDQTLGLVSEVNRRLWRYLKETAPPKGFPHVDVITLSCPISITLFPQPNGIIHFCNCQSPHCSSIRSVPRRSGTRRRTPSGTGT